MPVDDCCLTFEEWATEVLLVYMTQLRQRIIQGFFFSAPLPVAQCEPFLQGRCELERGGLAGQVASP
jgi:EAL domain-containing protein (putative c-di-GMP-specific phosphodiesterase class I)